MNEEGGFQEKPIAKKKRAFTELWKRKESLALRLNL